jgi:hypothetical protein
MTAAIIPIARGRRCAVCGGRSTKINRFSMCTHADGRDVFLHLDCCMPVWAAWQLTTCAVCGFGDRPDDPVGIFFNRRGGDVALHQACWAACPAQFDTTECLDCLFCGGGPDVGDKWRVFTGSIEPDGWIHARCRDGYVALCRDDLPRRDHARWDCLMDTYTSQAEFFADRAHLQIMLVALDAAHSQLRLDACRTWTIQGKHGYLATWVDGKRWFFYCSPGSARKWGNIRRALSPLGGCTQDGDDEDIIRIDQLPNPEQAAAIRKAIGLIKRPAVDTEASPEIFPRPSVWPLHGRQRAWTMGPVELAADTIDISTARKGGVGEAAE